MRTGTGHYTCRHRANTVHRQNSEDRLIKQLPAAVTVAVVLSIVACSDDSYESVAQEINALLQKHISMPAQDKDKVMQLRSEGERLHEDGKTQESLEALRQAREILQRAKDADLLRKSEG
jgi:Tfp pilus assembly protein PilN